ncbi:MAG: hypothetical protein RLO80_02675 [Hyphomonas sp.]
MALLKYEAFEKMRERDQQSMVAYQALIYPVFLVVALLGRIVPRFGSSARVRPSAFAEAADQTRNVVPWFFVYR